MAQQKVVVGVDGSEHSRCSLRFALDAAALRSARLVVVWVSSLCRTGRALGMSPPPTVAEVTTNLESGLRSMVRVVGSPLRQILLLVNLIGIFLVVVGVDAAIAALTKPRVYADETSRVDGLNTNRREVGSRSPEPCSPRPRMDRLLCDGRPADRSADRLERRASVRGPAASAHRHGMFR